jgi:hypothetical protein
MRKSQLTALAASGLVLFGLFFVPAAAFADDDDDDDDRDSSVIEPGKREHDETDRKHKDLEERYGKDGHLIVPPLVIRPEKDGEEHAIVAPPTGVGNTSGQNSIAPIGESVNIEGASIGRGFVLTTPSGGSVGQVVGPNMGQLANETLTSFDPEQNLPVEIGTSRAGSKTPADIFIESATVGLIAMGIGAISLGAIAGTRAIRRK